MKHYTIALAGNPNVGKSAWINLLAHADFKVGNWPGVTVEKKEARIYRHGCCYHLIDLPGTYSLQETRDEGRITACFLQENQVDLILNICDPQRLKRSLRLSMQLRELQLPMVIVCGFYDRAHRAGIRIDCDQLSSALGLPVCFLSAHQRAHREVLWQLIEDHCGQTCTYAPIYGRVLERTLQDLLVQIAPRLPEERSLNAAVYAFFRKEPVAGTGERLKRWQEAYPMEAMWMRYDALLDVLLERTVHRERGRPVYTLLDRILLHPLLAYPLCILFFCWFLQMVFRGSTPWSDYIQMVASDYLIPYLRYGMRSLPPAIVDFLTQGVVSGLAGVISFVPLMGTLYFWIAFLEESGYYARIAFLTDRIMSYFHLSGKAFLAMLLGCGCNVPGIIASRSLETQKQRMLTAVLVPFMSCSARLPVYLLFCASFFKGKEAMVIASLYGIGLFIAFLAAFLLSRLQLFREDAIQVYELPPYRLPSFKVLGKCAASECAAYLKKACSVVLMVMMVLWCFSYFPNGERSQSYLASAAREAAVIFEPLGFGDSWECVASLPGGIIAKESIIGFLHQQPSAAARRPQLQQDLPVLIEEALHSAKAAFLLEEVDVREPQTLTLWQGRSAPLKAYSFLVFVLLSIPCVMTLTAIASLYGRKLAVLCVVLMSVIPYVTAWLIYQGIGLFIG